MFVSFEFHQHTFNSFTKSTHYYKIIDSEFVKDGITKTDNIWTIIIDTYEELKLPVAKNLLKAILYHDRSLSVVPDWMRKNKEGNPKFAQYENDINKYLMLL